MTQLYNISGNKFKKIIFNYEYFNPDNNIIIDNNRVDSLFLRYNILEHLDKSFYYDYNVYIRFPRIKLNTDILLPYNKDTHNFLKEDIFLKNKYEEFNIDKYKNDRYFYNDDTSTLILNENNLLFDKDNYKMFYETFNKIDKFMFNNLEKINEMKIFKDYNFKMVYNKLCNDNFIKISLYNSNIYVLNDLDMLESYPNDIKHLLKVLHKNVYIQPILNLTNFYYTKPILKGKDKIIKFGIYPCFEQLIISTD